MEGVIGLTPAGHENCCYSVGHWRLYGCDPNGLQRTPLQATGHNGVDANTPETGIVNPADAQFLLELGSMVTYYNILAKR